MNLKLKDSTLIASAQQRILILDGAMGTSLQHMNLTADDFGGKDYEGCNENLVLTKPEAILEVHEKFLKAGADIVETNTFGATPLVLEEYQLQDQTIAINKAAVEIAKQACAKYSTPEKPRYVAGSMGPTTKSLSVTGGISFDELAHNFAVQAQALLEAGADYLLLETSLDTLNFKAGWVGVNQAFEAVGYKVPVAFSGTIETMGTMLAGQDAEAMYISMEHTKPFYIGLNCATGPEFMRDHIRTLADIAQCPIAVVPNAGLPDENGVYHETPQKLAEVLGQFIDSDWINMLGGCCGTTPEHIAALSQLAEGQTPRTPKTEQRSHVSGIDSLIVEEDNRPLIVGERSNVIGSRAFKRLIAEEKFEEAAEIARKQVKSGAHIIDVCLSNPDRDEVSDMQEFLSRAVKLVKAPIMIDSQVKEVVEEAFKLTQGKCILNSVNLEDGEKAFEELIPLVKQYGAAVVVGCIRGEMAVEPEDKLDVAIESHRILTEKYGIPEEDIIFDPLVFPCGTGDENYFGSGFKTIEGVRLIKEKLPRCKTVLGISNVSFGLPAAGREALNSVFVYHCTKAGLDMAIVNSEKMERYATLSDEEKGLCDDLLWYRTDNGNDPVANFAAYYRDKKVSVKETIDYSKLSIEERLEINIVEGTKERLLENLDEALKQWDPLGVINNPLMAAMAIVGRMFNDNELIVAEVLQSAEVMKAAVSYLEQFMDKAETNVKGTMLLATVKGDVHDIGKNLVEIILGNNGYKIVNLGIKCPPEVIIAAAKDHQPDLIGLSGLLVKSAEQMVITARDLKASGITTPILVGGAALSEKFTVNKINPEYEGEVVYCRDAMNGLDVSNKIVDQKNYPNWLKQHHQRNEDVISQSVKPSRVAVNTKEKLIIDHQNISTQAPHFDQVIMEKTAEDIWPLINDNMLYGKNLGLKGSFKRSIEGNDPKALKLQQTVNKVKDMIISENLFQPKALFRFFQTSAKGDSLIVHNAQTGQAIETFTFPRQSTGEQLCLSDFVAPNQMDSLCLFVTTCGCDVGAIARKLLDKGQYVDSHTFFALSMETAEALAELTHQHIRQIWGIPDPEDITKQAILQAKYTGTLASRLATLPAPGLKIKQSSGNFFNQKNILGFN